MRIIGLTGSFGTGKTFVASVLGSLGAQVIDADRVAHEVIRKGRPEYRRVVRVFGEGILNKSKEIDRRKLGGIVFSDEKLLKKLTGIVHPAVIREIKDLITSSSGEKSGVIVVDAPLLIEAKFDKLVDDIIVVECSKEKQIERCHEKFCLQKEEILKRIRRQMPLKKKMKRADFVINNNGTRSKTKKQIRKVWEEMSWK